MTIAIKRTRTRRLLEASRTCLMLPNLRGLITRGEGRVGNRLMEPITRGTLVSRDKYEEMGDMSSRRKETKMFWYEEQQMVGVQKNAGTDLTAFLVQLGCALASIVVRQVR